MNAGFPAWRGSGVWPGGFGKLFCSERRSTVSLSTGISFLGFGVKTARRRHWRTDSGVYSCGPGYGFGCIFFPTALLRRQLREDFAREFLDIGFRLVEIGNVGRAEAVERLLERENRFEGVALV